MKGYIEKQFKGLGFVEILIAIVVVGIVSAVFFSISASAMRDLIQTERIETMANIARDGFNIAQEVANQEKADVGSTNNYFPDDPGECYIPLRDEEENPVYKFQKEDGSFVFFSDPSTFPFPTEDRSDIVNYFETTFGESEEYFWGENYFMLMCIESIDDTSRWANVFFIVGDMDVAGQLTNDSDIQDFKYYAVIDL